MKKNNNLIPLNKRTKEEQRKITQSGGLASGISRKEKRQMKDILTYLLNCQTPEGISTKEAIGVALIRQCLEGNIRAFETLMCMIGEKPIEKPLDGISTIDLKKRAEEIRKRLFDRGEAEPLTIVVADERAKKMLEDI